MWRYFTLKSAFLMYNTNTCNFFFLCVWNNSLDIIPTNIIHGILAYIFRTVAFEPLLVSFYKYNVKMQKFYQAFTDCKVIFFQTSCSFVSNFRKYTLSQADPCFRTKVEPQHNIFSNFMFLMLILTKILKKITLSINHTSGNLAFLMYICVMEMCDYCLFVVSEDTLGRHIFRVHFLRIHLRDICIRLEFLK